FLSLTYIFSSRVFVSTWNVGGVTPSADLNMEDLLDTCNSPCDIYVLGFQEVVPLRAANVLGPQKSNIFMTWNSLIRDLRPYVRNPSVSCVGCGIMGCLGNKGSVSVRFRLHETAFCFVCCHLASGGRKGDEKNRNSNAAEILSRTTFPRGPSFDLPQKILDHDRVVMLGDLNYRISLPESATRLLVDKGDWNVLLQNDQLRKELMDGQAFEGWHEGTIKFAPTYKFYPNSDEYYGAVAGKKGEKKRAPAWCDRVIWSGEGMKQHLYTRGESRLSDHRPVKAIFTTEVRVSRTQRGNHSFFLSEKFDRITGRFEMPK
ncbi:hypothetical protein RJ639_004995, partial [Escallonia herrerae]